MCCPNFMSFTGCVALLQIKAKGTLMQMVAADWLKSDKREDDLGGRPGSIVQVASLILCEDNEHNIHMSFYKPAVYQLLSAEICS